MAWLCRDQAVYVTRRGHEVHELLFGLSNLFMYGYLVIDVFIRRQPVITDRPTCVVVSVVEKVNTTDQSQALSRSNRQLAPSDETTSATKTRSCK